MDVPILATIKPRLSSEQAMALAVLTDLEARWESLRAYPPARNETTLAELHQRQKAYEVFSAKMSAYNKAYRPAHVAEQLLNNPPRLSLWCRNMLDLYQTVQKETPTYCPAHVLAKAQRWADRVADRLKLGRVNPPAFGSTLPEVMRGLEEIAGWCDGLMGTSLAA